MPFWIQRVLGAGMAIAYAIFLLVIFRFTHPLVFMAAALFWLALVLAVGRYSARLHSGLRRLNGPALWLVFSVAALALLGIMEWWNLKIVLAILVCGILGVAAGAVVSPEIQPAHEFKPWRRIIMMIWVFSGYALVTAIFAVGAFFPAISRVWVALAAAAVLAGLSPVLWKMYIPARPYRFALWAAVIFLVMFEIGWIFSLLTFGYFASGFFITWLWYEIQLLVRFSFEPGGVFWSRQKWFLISNAALFALTFLLLARWV